MTAPAVRVSEARPPGATLELRGLAADNLLAFLALLGLLRALEVAKPEWHPRTSWTGPPWHPRLHLSGGTRAEEVAEAADAGVSILGRAYRFGERKNIDFTADQFRSFACAASTSALPDDRHTADLAAALASEVNLRRGADRVEGNALCAIYGQGHQHFLQRLEAYGRGSGQNGQSASKIAEALFQPWRYEDRAETFRWDPEEDRRYALGFADPSDEKIQTVAGANRLAAIGFPLFVCAPSASGLRTTAVRRGRRQSTITWPVWTVPAGPWTVRALLAHPDLLDDLPPRQRLSVYGVTEIFRARRIQTGKYFSFEPARPA